MLYLNRTKTIQNWAECQGLLDLIPKSFYVIPCFHEILGMIACKVIEKVHLDDLDLYVVTFAVLAMSV